MKKSSLLAVAALTGAAAVALSGCSGGGGTGGDSGGGDAAGRACVILPDAASSPRWENFDRKYLQGPLYAAVTGYYYPNGEPTGIEGAEDQLLAGLQAI
ncbi:MAG: hypothetical protein NT132_06390, partial [Microbacterium sp.]|nr:hypothetical protein [Microbacterium sp.]